MSLGDLIFPWINDTALGEGMTPYRAEVARGARGRVLEVAAGSGLNFAHYPAGTDVVAIEPARGMRIKAEQRRARSGASVQILDGRAERLAFDAGSFDTVIVTFALCSIKDLPGTIREIYRVLRPGGELRLVEHVQSERPRVRRLQERLEPVWRWAFGGCSLLRDVRAELAREGFEPGALRSIDLPLPLPAKAGLIGAAIRI
ncbi:MAG: class I SAM-dependent methyltransferase [Byssovorax sp.]